MAEKPVRTAPRPLKVSALKGKLPTPPPPHFLPKVKNQQAQPAKVKQVAQVIQK